jgi:hypothetical protein
MAACSCIVSRWYTTSAQNQSQSERAITNIKHNLLWYNTAWETLQRRNYVIYIPTAIDSKETTVSTAPNHIIFKYSFYINAVYLRLLNATIFLHLLFSSRKLNFTYINDKPDFQKNKSPGNTIPLMSNSEHIFSWIVTSNLLQDYFRNRIFLALRDIICAHLLHN